MKKLILIILTLAIFTSAGYIVTNKIIQNKNLVAMVGSISTNTHVYQKPLGIVIPPLSNFVEASVNIESRKINIENNYSNNNNYNMSLKNTTTKCGCSCPYAAKILILGKGSTANSPEVKWFQENISGLTAIYPLDGDGGIPARIKQIEDKIKELQGDKCPQPKILLIGYSLGGSIAKNLKSKFTCIDVIAIDPPNTNWCNFFIARMVSPSLRQICNANGVNANNTVNWTSGNSGDSANHYPWDNTVANKKKLKDLKSTINNMKCEL